MKKILTVLAIALMLVSTANASPEMKTILDGVVATGASSGVGCGIYESKTLYIVASDVTTGGVITVDTSPDNSNWVTLNTQTITGDGVTEVAIVGLVHKYIRANLTTRTDGTYTVYLFMKD